MYRPDTPFTSLSLFLPPYDAFVAVWDALSCPDRGAAVVWTIGDPASFQAEMDWLRTRPASVSLIVVLPPPSEAEWLIPRMRDLSSLRLRGVLPNSGVNNAETMRLLLRSAPRNLPSVAVTQFADHGILRNQNIRMLVGKIFELAPNVPSITQLSRKLYRSRRTLGRLFETEGLPVPSHWLQFARLLYVSALIQERPELPIMKAATAMRYPDGFTMSNQMKRLIGCRPSDVRENFGLSWIIEEWIKKECEEGRMNDTRVGRFIRLRDWINSAAIQTAGKL